MSERKGKRKKEYRENRERVYDIYGVPKCDRGCVYDCHHIIPISEGGGDNKGNLCPLKREEHVELHKKIDNHE